MISPRGTYYFNVRPRYTPGSPAMVPRDIAEHVAKQEKHGYQVALSGAWGETEKARAEEMGLAGIVEAIRERGKNWEVVDLCTEEFYERLISTPSTTPWRPIQYIRCMGEPEKWTCTTSDRVDIFHGMGTPIETCGKNHRSEESAKEHCRRLGAQKQRRKP